MMSLPRRYCATAWSAIAGSTLPAAFMSSIICACDSSRSLRLVSRLLYSSSLMPDTSDIFCWMFFSCSSNRCQRSPDASSSARKLPFASLTTARAVEPKMVESVVDES